MALSATARAMLDTLPAYYHGEPLVERIVQARANEIDRIDALIDKLKVELNPARATDDLGLLSMWERMLDLPAGPGGLTLTQRRAKVRGALAMMGVVEARDALEVLEAAIGGGAFTVERDTPDPLTDTLVVPFTSTSANAGVVARLARRLWPAHRQLLIDYAGGFVFDETPFDEATS